MTHSRNDARTKPSIKTNKNQRAQTNKRFFYKSNFLNAQNEDETRWKKKRLQNE